MFEKIHLPAWLKLTLWPFALFVLGLAVFSLLDLDFQVAGLLYGIANKFPYADSADYEFWLHRLPKQIAVGFFFLLVLLALIPWRGRTLKKWYVPLWLAIVSILISSSIVGDLKRNTNVYCPSQIQQFGGKHQETVSGPFPNFEGEGGHCWPGGHATTGMTFVALYFAFLMMAKPGIANISLWASLLVGHGLGIAQVVRGQHFLSHQLWTAAICWFVSLTVFWLWQRLAAARIWQDVAMQQGLRVPIRPE